MGNDDSWTLNIMNAAIPDLSRFTTLIDCHLTLVILELHIHGRSKIRSLKVTEVT